jgi:PQQ-like domain
VTDAAVIDLDRPPTASPGRRRHLLRPIGSVLAVTVAALTLGAAAAPAAPAVTAVLAVSDPVDDELLAPPYLYVAGGGAVRARPLVAGVRGWTAAVAGSADTPLNLTLRDGVLIAGTTVLDAATGAIRLRADAPGDRLVVGDGVAAVVTPAGAGDRLTVHDARTGRRLWSQTGPPVPPILLDGAGHLITVDPYGVATTRAVRDGRVLARADLGGGPPVWDYADPVDFAVAEVAGGHLYVRGATDDVPFLSEYDAATLTRRWRTDVPQEGQPLDCGTDVCLSNDAYLAAWRVTDGRFRWIRPGWGLVTPRPDGRLLVTDFQQSRAALLDPATGHADRRVDGGVVRGDLILHPDRGDPGHTSVLDLPTGQWLGRIATVLPATCSVAGGYLACLAGQNEIRVWRVRRQNSVAR